MVYEKSTVSNEMEGLNSKKNISESSPSEMVQDFFHN